MNKKWILFAGLMPLLGLIWISVAATGEGASMQQNEGEFLAFLPFMVSDVGSPPAAATPTPAPAATPDPDATPAVVILNNYTGYLPDENTFYLFGEVQNNRNQFTSFVEISGVLLDTNDNVVMERDVSVPIQDLYPGEKSCFLLLFNDIPGEWERIRFGISDYSESGRARGNLSILNDSASFSDDGELVITGELKNNETYLVNLISLIVTLYDNEEQVIGCQIQGFNSSLGNELDPGETGPFEFKYEAGNLTQDMTYRLQTRGR